MKYQHILFPTDGSIHSRKVIDHIKRLAKAFHSKVTIMCVYQMPYNLSTSFNLPPEIYQQYQQSNQRDAQAIVEEVVRELSVKKLDLDTVVVEGNPKLVICDYVKKHGCDLIVMGTRGHTDMNYIGSTSTYVIHNTPGCAVMVID